jgi:hypothetical protein
MASDITSDCNKTDILISFGHSGTTYCPEQDTTPLHFLSSRHKKDDRGSTNKQNQLLNTMVASAKNNSQ